MVMPLAGRVVAAVIGGLLVLASASSVIGTLIVTRSVGSRLTRWVDRIVDGAYHLVVKRAADYRRRDQLLATEAAAILLAQLAAWLVVAYVGFALLLWPFAARGVVSAFVDAGSSLFTLGFAVPAGAVPAVIVFAGRGDRPGDRHAADRLPADPVRGVQPQGDRGGAAERAGRRPVLGPGTAGAHPLRAGFGHVDPGHDAGAVHRVGTLGRRRRREPHHVPAAGPVPLAAAAVVLGYLAAGRAGLGRAVPGPVPQGRAGDTGPAVPARRVPVLQPDRPGDGHRHPRRARPGRRHRA